MNSVDLSQVKIQLDLLREEYRETEYLLELLKQMQLRDSLTGGRRFALLSKHFSALSKEKEYIQNRTRLLENSIEKFKWTKRAVSNDLDDAIDGLLNSIR